MTSKEPMSFKGARLRSTLELGVTESHTLLLGPSEAGVGHGVSAPPQGLMARVMPIQQGHGMGPYHGWAQTQLWNLLTVSWPVNDKHRNALSTGLS